MTRNCPLFSYSRLGLEQYQDPIVPMWTFVVLPNGSPSTRATQEHLASLPSRDEANLTIIQIKRQERSYYRLLKV